MLADEPSLIGHDGDPHDAIFAARAFRVKG
jgi:hypothetical protein